MLPVSRADKPARMRMGLTPALIVALTIAVSGQANRASQSQTRWYDAYREGVAAVNKRDWATAEKRLLEARSGGPRPGRRVFTYGDTYIAFLPDYYLGVVYLNTNRDREAENAFEQVRSQGVIAAKDPEYKAFERQGREAIFNRSFEEAIKAAAAGDATRANALLKEARATNVDDKKVASLSSEIARTAAQQTAQVQPNQVQQKTLPTPVPVTPPNTTAGGIPDAYKPPVVSNPLSPGRSNETLPVKGVIEPPKTVPPRTVPKDEPRSPALQNGVLAFFSGNYRAAIPLLQAAAQQPGMTPQARKYLACAKAGLVLTGGADAALLREARADLQSVDLMRTFSADERRYISPKVLEQLERQ